MMLRTDLRLLMQLVLVWGNEPTSLPLEFLVDNTSDLNQQSDQDRAALLSHVPIVSHGQIGIILLIQTKLCQFHL